MFCRFCGEAIAEDSYFCSKCGRRLGRARHPRLDHAVKVLRLKTPYPYFALILVVWLTWVLWPEGGRTDYTHLKMALELDRKKDFLQEKQFLQSFSLIVENTGTVEVRDIRVDLSALIEPSQPAEVVAGFTGERLLILRSGEPLPVELVLTDPVAAGAKRRFLLDGSIHAEPPFKVTYEVRQEDAGALLASYVVQP